MKTNYLLGLIAISVLVMGCQQGEPQAAPQAAAPAHSPAPAPMQQPAPPPPPQKGRVAVFDIDYVADQTGMFQDMKGKLKVKRGELNKELETFAKKLKETLQAEGKKIKKGKNQKREIAALEQGAQIKFRQEQAKADAVFKNYSVKLAAEMRDRIKPVAREVAFSKGFDVILLKNDMVVFENSDDVNLTQTILMAYQARHPDAVKKPEPALPKAGDKGGKDKKPKTKK